MLRDSNEVIELRRRIRAASLREATAQGFSLDPYQQYIDRYGNPIIETPHGTIIRPSLRGL